eukprot:NODE_468_length_7060_cov_0.310157.p2 type:complete len:344 gc:universal NODE_468_length_7060_cov_0.310157:1133-102(-)
MCIVHMMSNCISLTIASFITTFLQRGLLNMFWWVILNALTSQYGKIELVCHYNSQIKYMALSLGQSQVWRPKFSKYYKLKYASENARYVIKLKSVHRKAQYQVFKLGNENYKLLPEYWAMSESENSKFYCHVWNDVSVKINYWYMENNVKKFNTFTLRSNQESVEVNEKQIGLVCLNEKVMNCNLEIISNLKDVKQIALSRNGYGYGEYFHPFEFDLDGYYFRKGRFVFDSDGVDTLLSKMKLTVNMGQEKEEYEISNYLPTALFGGVNAIILDNGNFQLSYKDQKIKFKLEFVAQRGLFKYYKLIESVRLDLYKKSTSLATYMISHATHDSNTRLKIINFIS